MTASTFAAQLNYGQMGESRIARWLRAHGFTVLPVYEKEISTGKGPQLFSLDNSLIAPDMLAFRGKTVKWIEAKHKTVFSWYRIGNRWVTGIDQKHYNDYIKVALISPWPVWLLFLHENANTAEGPGNCPTGLFGQELLWLADHESHRSDKWGKSGMVYWAHATLRPLCSLVTIDSEAPKAKTPTGM
jgi:hypothetical protein